MKAELLKLIEEIQPIDIKYVKKMRKHHETLLMPTDALKLLLSYVEKLAGIYKEIPVRILRKKKIIVFAADHGVAEEGVSAYPQDVTRQMLGSFVKSFAVITVLAKHLNADITVVDMGVKGEAIISKKMLNKKIAQGTQNFLYEDAMTSIELKKALETGLQLAKKCKKNGYDIVLLGEMGIGNTTSTSAIVASLLNVPVKSVTGYGTGISKKTYQKKISTLQKALRNRKINKKDPFDILQKVGGFEIAAMVGFLLGAAYFRLPVILDGFIGDAAALVAYHINPLAKDYWIAGQVSQEKGDRNVLKKLSLKPILDLEFRLGEASGAAIAFPILEQAVAISRNTGTFSQAKVSNKK